MEAYVIWERLHRLREEMKRQGVDSLMIPTADYHNSEYVAPYFAARKYYSGFTGSAGTLLVRSNEAFLWTDGRYFIQAQKQLEGTGIRLMKMGEPGVPSLHQYLQQNMAQGSTLSFDGRCVSMKEGKQFEQELRQKDVHLLTNCDIAGAYWEERPNLPSNPVYILDVEKYAGETTESKLQKLRARMSEYGADVFVSERLDEIMWLYNIRGNDVECSPVALSYTIVTDKEARVYLQEEEMTLELGIYMKEIGAELRPYSTFYEDLHEMPLTAHSKIWIDPSATSYASYRCIQDNLVGALRVRYEPNPVYVEAAVQDHLVERMSPLLTMKAVRNPIEIQNTKDCFLEDSAVLTRFIYWLKQSVNDGEKLKESDAAEKLDSMRHEVSDFVELSFPTISAYGSNAAMMHYEAGEDGGAFLKKEGMYLVDSGGQYLRGTTDVTRTIALGPVTKEMKRDYTLTAISQLQMMDTVFLKGCNGMMLDIMAREPMWKNGMDYKCGTGHGIGYLLNVHEGPQCLRYKAREEGDETPFEPGMIVSDEPGVYKEGKYGIRIETILLCKEWGTTQDGTFLCFEPLTFVPLDRDLIDPSVLTKEAREILNRYHHQVQEKLAPFLHEKELEWLKEQCEEIPEV